METIQNDYPRPIPIPVMALRPVRGNCEKCHWPANFHRLATRCIAITSSPISRTLAGRSTCLLLVGGGGPETGRRLGIHWHVASKVEYVATDPERQNITWVRAVDPLTGAASVYTSQPQQSPHPPAAPKSEPWIAWTVITAPAISCKRPTDSVNAALEMAASMPSLPFMKQQGVAALAAAYTNREQAHAGNRRTRCCGYYRKTYPAVYTDKQQAIQAAVAHLRSYYNRLFLPVHESPLGHVLRERRVTLTFRAVSAATTASTRVPGRSRHPFRLRRLP